MAEAERSKSRGAVSLADLKPGTAAAVSHLRLDGLLYRRLLDLGIVEGTAIEAVYAGPSGDPVVYRVRGAHVALRKADASLVMVVPGVGDLDRPARAPADGPTRSMPKPRAETPPRAASDEDMLTVALAGNPNTGKSTVFNALTGMRQHVGNWPGKTVMRAEGRWEHVGRRFRLVDLPGTYSLLSTSVEEEIARDFVLFGNPDCTVIVADATCLERNLNLVAQILQITGRAVVCVNLIDEAERRGIGIDITALGSLLGVPAVGTAARTGRGLDALREAVFGVSTGAIATRPMILRYDEDLERAVDELVPGVEASLPGIPNARWIAMRLLDGGDHRLVEEVRNGILAEPSGRTGAASLPSAAPPAGREPGR